MKIQRVDLILSASWIIPVVPRGQILQNCALIIDQGKILALVPQQHAHSQFEAKHVIDLPNQALIPGLINAHGHSPMSLLRGYADDLSLMTWLHEHIWPVEKQWVDEAFVRDGSNLAMAEMLLSGTTCFSDMYFFPEATAQAAFHAGIRAQICFPILDNATNWGSGVDDYFHKGLALRDDYRSNARISIGFGPHAPYTVSDATFTKIATYAEELQAPVQVHLHETADEIEQSIKDFGVRPLQRLANLGVISPLTQCVHMTQIDNSDIEILQNSGAHVVHCPDSNLKLASGICPTQTLLDASINLALGTDGAASNNDLNMLAEMQTAALVGKYRAQDASAITATTALEMATINGAKALGLDTEIGSLEVGKAADIVAVNLATIGLTPIYNPLSQLVYSQSSQQVSNLWVGGKQLVKEGQLTTLNAFEISEAARQWRHRIMAP